MPQFDLFIIGSQVFWLLVKFFVFYYYILYTYIAQFISVMKFRNKLIKKYSVINTTVKAGYNPFLSLYFKNRK